MPISSTKNIKVKYCVFCWNLPLIQKREKGLLPTVDFFTKSNGYKQWKSMFICLVVQNDLQKKSHDKSGLSAGVSYTNKEWHNLWQKRKYIKKCNSNKCQSCALLCNNRITQIAYQSLTLPKGHTCLRKCKIY